MKTEIRGLLPSDMPSFIDLCESRPELNRKQAEERAAIVERVAFHNPCDDGSPTYWVGVQGDRVLAHLGRMPTEFCVRGKRELASYFHDLYVHPELRKSDAQGFFLTMKLYRKAEKSSKSFCAMVWTNEINISLQKARKYHQTWTDRRVMVLGLSEKVGSKVPAPLSGPAASAVRQLVKAGNWANGLRFKSKSRVEQISSFDERFDELAERSLASMRICPYKDHKYLNWKYVDRPGLDASYLQLLDQDGTLNGFAVLVHPDDRKAASIAELSVADNDTDSIHALLAAIIGLAEELGADHLFAVATDAAYAGALQNRVFRRTGRIPLFLARTEQSPNESYLKRPSNWHMSLGDSEGPF